MTIGRGKFGGPRVTSIDVATVADQVGNVLQMQATTLDEIWFARIVIEPPAAALLARERRKDAVEALERNVAAAREASRSDLLRYADLNAEFSLLLIRHCGNRPIALLGSLIYDIIRRQHENVTLRTMSRESVNRLREDSITDREKAIVLMQRGETVRVEASGESIFCK